MRIGEKVGIEKFNDYQQKLYHHEEHEGTT